MWLPWQRRNDPQAVVQLGSLESRMVEVLWSAGEASVRAVQAQMPELAYTTVMTTLDRLYKKGILERRQQERAFIYRAHFSRQEYESRLAQQLLGMAFTDENRNVVLASFVDHVSETDMKLLDELERLVKQKRRASARAARRTK